MSGTQAGRACGHPDHRRGGEHQAGPGDREQQPVGVVPAEQGRPAQRSLVFEQLRRRQQPVLAQQRAELRGGGGERDQVHQRDPALQHLPREFVVGRVEPVHSVHARTVAPRRQVTSPLPLPRRLKPVSRKICPDRTRVRGSRGLGDRNSLKRDRERGGCRMAGCRKATGCRMAGSRKPGGPATGCRKPGSLDPAINRPHRYVERDRP